MDFNANQMREDALTPEGRYRFKVKDAREKRSQAGNEMINLKLVLQRGERWVPQFDSLILIPSMFWKVEHFCKATGMPQKIDEGRLIAQDCQDKEGELEIVHKPNPETGELEAKVKDYIKLEDLQEAPMDFDDEVPDFKS